MMETFRLATLNVHSFNNPETYKNNVEDLVRVLSPLNLDLLAGQEVLEGDKWAQFCQRLSLPFSVYGSSGTSFFGNGFASRHPIASHSTFVSKVVASGGCRSLLECTLAGDHPFVQDRKFGVTHLDHMSEKDRIKQIEDFDPVSKNIDILMGDMNALSKGDYTENYAEKNIIQVRQRSSWERPYFDLTKLITKYWSYQDAFKLINPDAVDEQVVTCRFHTRIDYIFLRPKQNDRWMLKECFIHDTQGATDHHAVVATFQLK